VVGDEGLHNQQMAISAPKAILDVDACQNYMGSFPYGHSLTIAGRLKPYETFTVRFDKGPASPSTYFEWFSSFTADGEGKYYITGLWIPFTYGVPNVGGQYKVTVLTTRTGPTGIPYSYQEVYLGQWKAEFDNRCTYRQMPACIPGLNVDSMPK
jgi:hypothetical protein